MVSYGRPSAQNQSVGGTMSSGGSYRNSNTITITTLGWAEWMAGNCLLSHWCHIGWGVGEGLLDKPGLTTLLWGKEEHEVVGLGGLNWDNSILFGQVFTG